ncbi:hypothetical protein [Noviherbaspirillum suwonense]|jgi:hypothetical protein|uniref:hypothetical protein n=1 Tax=Noviherbaspirillum suwonense TaxID=1224511 RepID=UPI0010F42C88|nr:hypothetical protein [Noviherbaspirillum suwonense]RYD89048.1 MAG: hypothetical protein EOP50_18090 [Sphingobacteriales bacterium]
MSLNKHDLDSYRRAKRLRAQKIDFLIVVLFILIAIFMTMEHPPPRPGAPAFHKVEAREAPKGKPQEPPVIARAAH